MNIIPIEKKHSGDLAKMHLAFLRTPFRGWAGLKLLAIYYQALADGVGAAGFVAEENSKIVGYVCGIWSPGSLKAHFVRRYFFGLVFWAVCQLISRLQMLPGLLQKLWDRPAGADPVGYELRPIVVMPDYRGTGLAGRLAQYVMDDAFKRGYEYIFLYTEADNMAAQNFYLRAGFQNRGIEHRANGDYYRYESSPRVRV